MTEQFHPMDRAADVDGPASCEASRAPDGAVRSLTERQREILDLVSNGYLNKQIANRMGITEATVKHHMANVKDRLAARSRAHAVAMWVRASIAEGRA